MRDIVIENRIPEIIGFFDLPDSLTKQSEGVTQIKRSKALGNFGIAIVLIVLGALASIYGIADVFGGKILPLGVLFLIGGPIMVLGGIYMVLSSTARAATASEVNLGTDLEDVCRSFYANAFCKKTTDFGSKDDQIVDACQFIPVPVLEHYRKSGWDTYIGKSKPRSKAQPMVCSQCQKEADHSEAHYTSIPIDTKYREEYRSEEPVETQNLIKNLYLKCEDCGSVVCYECLAYSARKTERFLCPVCGKATNGWDGLASRWMNLRYTRTGQDVDFALSSVVVDKAPRSDPRVVDVTIRLSGTPFGTLTLSNVAFNVDGKWFLASPEPLLAGALPTETPKTAEESQASVKEPAKGEVPVDSGRLATSVGIETLGGVFTTLIEAGSPVPCDRTEIFSTAADNQTEIEVHVLHGTSERASDNVSLGKFKLTGLPKASRGVPQIEVTFRVQADSRFVLMAQNLGDGTHVRVVCT